VSVVASAIAKGTLRIFASVCASSVLPVPVGPSSRMFDFCSSTSVARALRLDALVVVVHRHGEDLLRAVLPDHVVVEDGLDLRGLRDGGRAAELLSRSTSSAMMSLQSPMHSSQM
jgi:hypothetical protein